MSKPPWRFSWELPVKPSCGPRPLFSTVRFNRKLYGRRTGPVSVEQNGFFIKQRRFASCTAPLLQLLFHFISALISHGAETAEHLFRFYRARFRPFRFTGPEARRASDSRRGLPMCNRGSGGASFPQASASLWNTARRRPPPYSRQSPPA